MDGKTKNEIMKLLGKLNAEQDTTILVVTHDGHVASMTRRMLFLSDGKLLAKEKRGTHRNRQALQEHPKPKKGSL